MATYLDPVIEEINELYEKGMHTCCMFVKTVIMPYSRKYWWSLNLVVWLQTSHLEYWLNLNLAVHNGIAIICIYASKHFGGF